jgi:protein gp37
MARTAIEWTEATWNPVTGCTKISEGCAHCYAERMAKRLKAMGQKRYRNGFAVTLHNEIIETPLQWEKPTSIFVNSMSDLFHENVPADFILSVFTTMRRARHHRFQVLTKRAERLAALDEKLIWTPNILMGVTVENRRAVHRIESLRSCQAATKFISFEPLLESIGRLDLSGIGWVIVGGESGPGARKMKEEWVFEIKEQAVAYGIPFFFKQWGGVFKKRAGRLLNGRTWDEMPAAIGTVLRNRF